MFIDKLSINTLRRNHQNRDFNYSFNTQSYNLTLPPQLKNDTFQLNFNGKENSDDTTELFPKILNSLDNLNDEKSFKSVCENIDKLNSIVASQSIPSNAIINSLQNTILLKKLSTVFIKNHTKPEFDELSQKIDTLFFNSYKNLTTDSSKKTIEDTYSEIIKNPGSSYGQIQAKKFFLTFNPNHYQEFDCLRNAVDKLNSINATNSQEYKIARANLLKQEFNILRQELINPEHHIERAKQEGVFSEDNLLKPEDKIKLNALRGLEFHLHMSQSFDKIISVDDELFNTLCRTISNDSENTETKTLSIKILKSVYDNLSNKQKQDLKNITFKNIFNHSDNYFTRLYSADLFAKLAENDPVGKEDINSLIQLQQSNDINNKKLSLITLAKLNYSDINDILVSNLDNQELKTTVLWAAGKVKNNNNYALLKQEITKNIFNIDKTDVNKIENISIALVSFAEYSNISKDNTIKFLKDFKSDIPELNELANELIIKLEPSNYTEHFSDNYKEIRTKFFEDYAKVAPNIQRWTDKAFYPFMSILVRENDENLLKQVHCIDDLLTSKAPIARGIRTNYGFYADTASGVTMPGGEIIIPKSDMTSPDEDIFVLGHEFGHHVHYYLMKNDIELANKIEKAFASGNNTKFLDLYGAQMCEEYFAEANEAYLSIYKPHDSIIFADDPEYMDGNTIFKLMKKDPEMYKLMQEIYKKYSV